MAAPRKYDHDLARDLYADGCTVNEIAKFFNVAGPSIKRTVDPAERERQAKADSFRHKRKKAQTGN